MHPNLNPFKNTLMVFIIPDMWGEWRYNSIHSYPRYSMEVIGQLRDPAAYSPKKELPVCIV
jgi:hypothetical protein